MGDLKIEKTETKTEVVDEVPVVKVSEPTVVDESEPKSEMKPEEEVSIKKEIPQEILDYCAEIAKTINDKFDAKCDELKAMIEGTVTEPKPTVDPEEIIELKKSIKELRKEVASSSQADEMNVSVKKVKTLLS